MLDNKHTTIIESCMFLSGQKNIHLLGRYNLTDIHKQIYVQHYLPKFIIQFLKITSWVSCVYMVGLSKSGCILYNQKSGCFNKNKIDEGCFSL